MNVYSIAPFLSSFFGLFYAIDIISCKIRFYKLTAEIDLELYTQYSVHAHQTPIPFLCLIRFAQHLVDE